MPSNSLPAGTSIRLGVWAADNNFHFLEPVLERLPERYKIQRFTWSPEVPESIMKRQLERVDVVWFEWGDGPAIPGSRLVANKPTICRIHRYEIYSPAPRHIHWQNIDCLTLISQTMCAMFMEKHGNVFSPGIPIEVVPNAIDVAHFPFRTEKEPNYNLAFLARIHAVKNPMLLLQIFKKVVDRDERYQLHIAGQVQHTEVAEYLVHQIKQMGLHHNVHFYGHLSREEVLQFLPQCSHLLSTSIIEGHPVGIMEGMAVGLRPVIHDFLGSRALYPEEFIFNTVDEAVDMILNAPLEPERYRAFIEEHYNLPQQVEHYVSMLDALVSRYYPEAITA